MSAGFLIFLSGKKRYAFSHTSMLVHSGSAAFQGTAEQIEEAQKNYKKQKLHPAQFATGKKRKKNNVSTIKRGPFAVDKTCAG